MPSNQEYVLGKPVQGLNQHRMSHLVQWLLILAVTGIYTLLFAAFYPTAGAVVAALSALPAILTVWFYGMQVGLVFVVSLTLLNALLLNLIGNTHWNVIIQQSVGPGTLVLFAVTLVVGRMRDIGRGLDGELAKRHQIEADLRDSEERSRQLADAAFEALAIHDHGVIIEANQASCRMSGYDYSEVNRQCAQIHHSGRHSDDPNIGARTGCY